MELVTNVEKKILKLAIINVAMLFLKKNGMKVLKNENIKWDDQYKNVIKAIEKEKILLSLVEVELENLI